MKYKLTSVADCLFSLSSDYLSNQYSYGNIFLQKFIENGYSICRLFSKQAEFKFKGTFSGYDNFSSISEL